MCNVTIAKTKLQRLKLRTQKDIYGLTYGTEQFTELTEKTYSQVKNICKKNGLLFPLKKENGEITFKDNGDYIFESLSELANNFDIYLDYTKILQEKLV